MIITILHFKIKNISTSKAGKGINYLKPENIKVKKKRCHIGPELKYKEVG